MLDVLYVPFHDARKWTAEGIRTRDGHVSRELCKITGQSLPVVADRPTSLAEYVRRRGRWHGPESVRQPGPRTRISRAPTGADAIDVLVPDLGFRRGSFHLWQLEAYGAAPYQTGLRRALEHIGMDVSTLWLCHPFASRIRGGWSDARVLLDAFDNFAIHPELPSPVQAAAREAYAELCTAADRIVVNSVAMQSYLWELARRESVVIPNGVDPELFSRASPLRRVVTARPIIGYAGKLGRRIDVELLIRTADALAFGSIVIAGQVLSARWMRAALSHPRIRHLGDLHYSEIPSFLAACDVCIVPHRVGEGENHGDATKIYEYLAAQKPVITTAIGGVDRFVGRITVAQSPAAFVEAVCAAARGEPMPCGALLEAETWRARTESMLEYFEILPA